MARLYLKRKTAMHLTRFVILCLFVSLSLFFFGAFSSVVASEGRGGTVFFQTLQDIPAMQGLSEIEDYALVFDKPEGRIVEMVAQIKGASVDAVRRYYAGVLPQLGWAKEREDHYIRGNERLALDFEQESAGNFVRFTVEPR